MRIFRFCGLWWFKCKTHWGSISIRTWHFVEFLHSNSSFPWQLTQNFQILQSKMIQIQEEWKLQFKILGTEISVTEFLRGNSKIPQQQNQNFQILWSKTIQMQKKKGAWRCPRWFKLYKHFNAQHAHDIHNLRDHISKIAFFIPTKNQWQKLKFFKKQKSQKCTFCDSEKIKHHWSTNEYH